MKRLYLVFLCSVLLVSCGPKEKPPVPKPEIPKVEEPKKEEIKPLLAPLNGMEVAQVFEQRPIAVMINNHEKARPQSGLSQADLVYEVLAEGDITRFLAIFQSQMPNRVGPIRSARDYFIKLAEGYNALYICHGYSPEAKKMLAAGVIDALNGIQYDGTLFKRDNSRKAPHNSYITTEKIRLGATENGYAITSTTTPLTFSTKKMEGTVANEVRIHYSNSAINQVTYRYEQGAYQRLQGESVATDLENKNPLEIATIFVVEATHTLESDGYRRNIDLTSGGRGYLISKGSKRDVLWKNQDGRILPITETGEIIPFSPGQTWINVVPSLEIVKIK